MLRVARRWPFGERSCPTPVRTPTTSSSSSASQSKRREGRPLGVVAEVENLPANDVLVLDSGYLLPLVDACVLDVDLEAGRVLVARGFADDD